MKKNKYISKNVTVMWIITNVFILVLITLISILSGIEERYMIFILIALLLFIIINYFNYKYVYKYYKESSKLLELFIRGYTMKELFNQRIFLSPEMEKATKKFEEIINTKDLIKSYERQSEYLALQNQINPHFLYNTLEGIRGETLNAGLDSVAQMIEALSTFFRYTISNVNNLVSLEDELGNVENYYIIQQYRFGDRINLKLNIEDEEKVLKYKIPKLTLQPIVENAIYHGVERKIEDGNININIETTTSRMIITISDDGYGIEEEKLEELNNKLTLISFEDMEIDNKKQGGIALINVNRRIKLLFGEQYGVFIYSKVGAGTDVEITIPLI